MFFFNKQRMELNQARVEEGNSRLWLRSRPGAKAWHQPQQEEVDKQRDNDIRHFYSHPETAASAI